jgi:hypothetical protein
MKINYSYHLNVTEKGIALPSKPLPSLINCKFQIFKKNDYAEKLVRRLHQAAT